MRLFPVLLATLAAALEVSVDSPCAPICIDDPAKGNASDPIASLTFNRDLFCYDWEVEGANSTGVGRKFKECNNCLKDSGFVKESKDERDVTWFMFNNRGVVDWCLFGRFAEESNPNISTTPVYKSCNSHCNKLYNAADYTIKSNLDSYSFCSQDGDFGTNAESCLSCLYSTPGLNMLGNVLAMIVDMCKKTPTNNYTFPKDQQIYSPAKIKLSSTSASSNSSSSASPSASASSSSSNGAKVGSIGLSKGALAGIVLGALILVILVLVGVLMLFRLKKNQKKSMAVSGNGEAVHVAQGNYEYQPVGGGQKGVYAQQPVEMGHESRAELMERGGAVELGDGVVGRRYK